MSLISLKEQAEENAKKRLVVMNPHHQDLTISYEGISYLIESGQSVEMDYFKAHHLAKHIANAILEAKGKPMTEENRQEIMGSILV